MIIKKVTAMSSENHSEEKRTEDGVSSPPPPRRRRPITCPVWRSTQLDIVDGGVEVRCKSCRHGVIHFYSQASFEQAWADLAAERARAEQGA